MDSQAVKARQGDPSVIQSAGADLISPLGQQRQVQVYQKAVQNKPALDSLLTNVALRTGARSITGLKNPETAIKKVVDKRVSGEKGADLEDISDIVRGRLVFSSKEKLDQGLQLLKQEAKTLGMKITKEDDQFKANNPTGYKGYHVDLKAPSGQDMEVQLHTLQTYTAAMATEAQHQSYGDNEPADAEEQDKRLSDAIGRLPNGQSNLIASQLEQRVMPQNLISQLKALAASQGSPSAPVAEPLQAVPSRYQQAIGEQGGL